MLLLAAPPLLLRLLLPPDKVALLLLFAFLSSPLAAAASRFSAADSFFVDFADEVLADFLVALLALELELADRWVWPCVLTSWVTEKVAVAAAVSPSCCCKLLEDLSSIPLAFLKINKFVDI